MQAGTQQVNGSKRNGVKARKGKDGQEAALKNSVLKSRMAELVRLKKQSDEASEDLSDAIKVAAEQSGYLASVIRKVVTAKAGEDFDGKKREAEQLELAFQAAE